MTDGNGHYPDAAPDPLGDLKSIARLPAMQSPAPKIRWGDEYRSWPVERRLDYAERLASAMNHAADVLQTERADLLARLSRQEAQLRQNAVTYIAQGELMSRELAGAGVREQELAQEVVRLGAELRASKKVVK